jgi:hypothetical protein
MTSPRERIEFVSQGPTVLCNEQPARSTVGSRKLNYGSEGKTQIASNSKSISLSANAFRYYLLSRITLLVFLTMRAISQKWTASGKIVF